MKPQVEKKSDKKPSDKDFPKKVRVVKNKLVKVMEDVMTLCFNRAEDLVFQKFNQADNKEEQDDFYFAMKEINKQKQALAKLFSVDCGRLFEKVQTNSSEGLVNNSITLEELSVISNDDLDLVVANEALINRLNKTFNYDVERVAQSLGKVYGYKVSSEINPVTPDNLCNMFFATLHHLDVAVAVKSMLLALFEKQLQKILPSLCRWIHKTLEESDANKIAQMEKASQEQKKLKLPDLQDVPDLVKPNAQTISNLNLPPQTNSASEQNRSNTQGTVSNNEGTVSNNQPFQSGDTRLNGTHTGNTESGLNQGNSSFAGGSGFSTVQSQTAPCSSNIGVVNQQNNSGGMTASNQPVSSAGVGVIAQGAAALSQNSVNGSLAQGEQAAQEVSGHALMGMLHHLQQNTNSEQQLADCGLEKMLLGQQAYEQSISASDRQVVHVISHLFEHFNQENIFTSPIQSLLARIQIPLAKIALCDSSFFSRSEHAARKLVNAFTDASIKWQSDDSSDYVKDPVYKKMQEIVDNLAEKYDLNETTFSQCLAEFEKFNQRELHRSALLEKRLQAVEEGKEKAEIARVAVSKTIAELTAEKDLKAAISALIHQAWHQVMFTTCLKHGNDSDSWNQVIGTLQDLIWCAEPITTEQQCEQIKKLIPKIRHQIIDGLKLINLNPFQTEKIMSGLDAIMSAQAKQQIKGGENVSILFDKNEAKGPQKIPLEAIPPSDRMKLSSPKSDDLKKEEHKAKTDENPFFTQAKSFARGTWFDYDAGEEKLRCRLAAVIGQTDKYIFVNRSGAKVLELYLPDFAKCIEKEQMTSIEGSQLFDRALEKVIVGLRKQQKNGAEKLA